MNNPPKKDFDIIEKLVQEEQKAADAILSEEKLRTRLKNRFSEERKKGRFLVRHQKKVWISAGIASSAAVIVLVFLALATGKRHSPLPFENQIALFLQNSPGIRTLSQWEELLRYRAESAHNPDAAFLQYIRKSFEEPRGKAFSDNQQRPALIIPQKPVFDTKRRMEILFKEKAVHRFLNRFMLEKKEEKNG